MATDEQLELVLAAIAGTLHAAADVAERLADVLAGIADLGRFLAWLFERDEDPHAEGWA